MSDQCFLRTDFFVLSYLWQLYQFGKWYFKYKDYVEKEQITNQAPYAQLALATIENCLFCVGCATQLL